MKEFLKKSLLYLVMTVVAVPLWAVTGYITAPVAKATAPSIEFINEGFDNAPTAPTNWTFAGITGSYTGTGYYGTTAPAVKMDATGVQIVSPLFANATSMTFWLRGVGTSGSSALLVETYNGTSWSTPTDGNITSIPTSGTTKTITLSSSDRQVRFTYTKDSGNIAIDDVIVSGSNVAVFIDSNTNSSFDVNEPTFATIQNAVDGASTGDAIVVNSGTYNETVNVNKGVSIVGASVAGTYLIPTTGQNGFNVTADDAAIKNFTIVSTSGGVNTQAITVTGANNVTISGNTITTSGDNGLGVWIGGTGYSNSNNLTISNNIITISNVSTGIYAEAGATAQTGWMISENTITANYGNPLELYDVSASTVNNNALTALSYDNSIVIWTSELGPIANLVFTNNTLGGGSGSQVAFLTDFRVDLGDSTVGSIAGITITGNSLDDWGLRGLRIGAGSITSVIANKNSFLATGTALKNEGSGDIDATQNWWNTTSASIITGEIDNASTGSVTYKPYYIDSAMTTLSDNKAISTFDFNGLSPAVTGTVDTSAHTVSLTVPNGTDVTALVPTITTTSVASTPVSPASDVAKDFTNSVTYTISAIDGTTQDYTVTVTVSPDTTGPTISGVTNGETYETAKTVTVGSDAASIFVNNVAYTSGNTITLSANDGYTITATDAIGNSTTVNFTIDIAPAISVQSSSSASATSITITWTTDQPATSRVIYDTVSHSSIADYVAGSNYGYANSTATFDMGDSKTESHSITISGLVAGTTYYYRTISSGSPETVSVTESSFTTSPTTPAPAAAETTETTTSITPLIASAKSAPAPAAEAAPEATATPDDSNGVVKAAEASSPESNESTNWTPWIVLAVLIILAGAVTGGYFYWFSGREEMAAATTGDMKKIQNNAKTENAKVVVREKTKSNTRKPNGKKPNRW